MNSSRCTMRPGAVWHDTDGKPIQAHGGGVLFHEGTYYWYGENKDAPNVPGTQRVEVIGVSCYSSRDLLNWTNEGLALPAEVSKEGDLRIPWRDSWDVRKAQRQPNKKKVL